MLNALEARTLCIVPILEPPQVVGKLTTHEETPPFPSTYTTFIPKIFNVMITPLEHGEELTAQDPQACDSVTLPLASTDALPHALALAPVLHQIVFPLYGDIIACVPVPPDPDALAQTPDWQSTSRFIFHRYNPDNRYPMSRTYTRGCERPEKSCAACSQRDMSKCP